MKSGDVCHIMGNPVYKDYCYLRSVEIDPTFAAGWYNLGLSIEPGLVVDYNGVEYGRRECFREAVIVNPRFAPAWNALGNCMPRGKELKLPEGRRVSRKDCFKEALSIDPSLHEAWYNLSVVMKPDEFAEIDGNKYTKNECLRRSGQRHRDRDRDSTESPRSNSSARSSRRSSDDGRGKNNCSIS